MNRRMTLAVPNKGRLVEPTLELLHDAGLVFEERDRSLVSSVENVPLDILFVRTGDVVEFVRDGVADIGITGADLLAESGADLEVVRRLGYGRCRLAAAVPRAAVQRDVAELAGLRVATAHPASTAAFFAGRRIPVEVISLSGAVEVAPRLGLAEAIVDLVSSGTTLADNGLREIATILSSEAILVGRSQPLDAHDGVVARLDTMLGAVLAARRRKYVLMNAALDRRAALESLLPGLGSPSIVPLAHAGMIAIHAVVDADEIWDLLPRLKAAGASGILVLPIEKLVA
jgi:ATP phosphoribosyltransferase